MIPDVKEDGTSSDCKLAPEVGIIQVCSLYLYKHACRCGPCSSRCDGRTNIGREGRGQHEEDPQLKLTLAIVLVVARLHLNM